LSAKDTVTAAYLQDPIIFADVFNFLLYKGRKVVNPARLRELDTKISGFPYGGVKGAKQPVQRIRDVMKFISVMTDENAAYLILAVENQSEIHYAMPVRNMVCDSLQYAIQVEKAAKSHKESGDKYRDSGEYLSGFMRTDHLVPIVTLVIYFGADVWDAPMSIHEMFAFKDKELLSYVPDYRLNLIAPSAIADEDFDKFSSSLKEVLSFIKYSKDHNKLSALMDSNENFQHMGRREVDVLTECTGVKLHTAKGKERVNVCKAIQDMIDIAVQEERDKAVRAIDEAVQEERNRAIRAVNEAIQEERNKADQAVKEEHNKMCKAIQDMIDIAVQEERNRANQYIQDMVDKAMQEERDKAIQALDEALQEERDKANRALDEALQEERDKANRAVQEERDKANQAVQEERNIKRQAVMEAVQKLFVDTCKEFGVSLAETIVKFSQKFGVSEEDEARDIVQSYWGES